MIGNMFGPNGMRFSIACLPTSGWDRQRCIDLVIVLTLAPIVVPFVTLLAMLVACTSWGNPIYTQWRMGHHGRLFRLIKLRTMVADSAPMGRAITVAGDLRITRVGSWLRAMKCDELPQLWHVLVGDMRIVGPRPEVPEYADCFVGTAARIHSVRPGMVDTASLVFCREADLLALSTDPERAYRHVILPAKIQLALRDIDDAAQYGPWIQMWRLMRIAYAGERYRRTHPMIIHVKSAIAAGNRAAWKRD